MSEPFAALIAEMARFVGLEPAASLGSPVEFKVDGVALTLAYDDRSTGDDLLIHASLGTVPEAKEVEVYRVLLEANLFWSATADATIGVNSDTREAILAYRLPLAGMDGEMLAKICAHFLEVAGGWREFLTKVAETGDEPVTPPQFDAGMIRA